MASNVTPAEWDLICYAEQFWRINKCFPQISEISQELNITRPNVSGLLGSPTVQKHLTARGIDMWKEEPNHDSKAGKRREGKSARLSDIQLAVASTVLNPADRRSLTEKLKGLGVAPVTYNGWKKSKPFMDYLTQQSEELFGETLPEVNNTLAVKASQGDTKAMKLFYEISGRWRGVNSDGGENVKLLIIKFIEVLQRHIHDPIVMQNIALEIGMIASGGQPQTTNLISESPVPIRAEAISDGNHT